MAFGRERERETEERTRARGSARGSGWLRGVVRGIQTRRGEEGRQGGRRWRGAAVRARRARAVPLSGRKTTEGGSSGGLGQREELASWAGYR